MPSTTPPAGSLFGNVDYTDPTSVAGATGKAAGQQFQQGLNLANLGTEGLMPVFSRLMKLLSGDPGAVDEATMPQRASILHQYDTALQAAERNAPRGGGQASGAMALGAEKATQLSQVKSKAISDATGQLGQLAQGAAGIGLQAEQGATATLGGLIQQALTQQTNTREMWMSIGKVAGAAALTYFSGGAAAPLLAGALASSSFGKSSGDFSTGVAPGNANA